MQAKTNRKKGLEVDPEEMPPLHYGHRIRADHIIIGKDLSKGSEGEQACLVCLDEYSGCLQAFPQTSRTTDANIGALQAFGGTRAHGKALCIAKTDAAAELIDAVKYLGWLPSPSVPNDPVHNAKLERSIRSIKEGARAILLKSSLDHQHWPRAVEYFCVAHAITNQAQIHPNESDEKKIEKSAQTCYEAAAGEAFTGLRLPFGCLVYLQSTVNSPHSSLGHIQVSLWVGGLMQGFITEMSIWFLITRISFQKLRVVVDPSKSTSLSLLNPLRGIGFFHCSKQR